MRKVYLDKTEIAECVGVFLRDAEVIPAGATVSAMSVRHKNGEYERYAEEYDIHFIFADQVPAVDFYTVPQVDIFAVDSHGGCLGALGETLDRDSRICYIDRDHNCFLVSENGRQFLQNPKDWQEKLAPCASVEIFQTKGEAKEKYEFLDEDEIMNSMKKGIQ